MAIRLSKIEYLAQHGQEVDQELDALTDLARRAELIKTAGIDGVRVLGLAKLQKLEQLQSRDIVPTALFVDTLALFERARGLNSTSVFLNDDFMRYHMVHAKNEMVLGGSPQQDIDKGLQLAAQMEKSSQSLYGFMVSTARLYALAGRVQSVPERSDGLLSQAAAAARKAVSMSPKSAETHDVLCEVLRDGVRVWRARRAPAAQRAVETATWLEQGIKACTATLDIDATRATAHANLGALFLLRAQQRTDGGAQRKDATHAARSLTTALEINKWLQRDYGPLLAAAQKLAAAQAIPSKSALPDAP
jgi:hypothetical protein